MAETSWRVLIGALAVALVVVGGILFALLIGAGGPSPTGTPFAVGSASPRPSTQPTVGPSATPARTEKPTRVPEVTLSPTPEPTVEPSAEVTEGPTMAVGGPLRSIEITGLGLDAEDAEGAVARLFSFQVDGPAQIIARISNVSAGRVHTCLWLGDALDVQDQECKDLSKGRLERTITEPGQTTWTVSLIGAGSQISPSADLALSFNTQGASLGFDAIRFQGVDTPNYNGITAEFPVLNAGEAQLLAEIDDGVGGEYPYRLVIERLGNDGGVVHESGGAPADSVDAAQSVSAGRSYRLTLSNTQEFTEQQVFLRGALTWP